MSEIIRFSKMQVGKKFTTTALVVDMTELTAKNGFRFVKMVLSDGYRSITANYFHVTLEELESIDVVNNTVVEITLLAQDKYFNVVDVEKCTDTDITPEHFRHSLVPDPEGMFDSMLDIIRRNDPREDETATLSELTVFILNCYKERFIRSSAAKTIHHNGLGGLLLHTFNMMDAAERLEFTYPFELDMQLLVCGIALHDIGKIKELETTEQGDAIYTPEGRLMGHSALGMEMVDEFNHIVHCSQDRVELLKHMIAAHHGSTEHGAIVAPAIPEAMVLHALDMMDSRIFQFEAEYKKLEPGSLSGRVYGLENATVYLPRRGGVPTKKETA